jgi:chromosome segregation ATPase
VTPPGVRKPGVNDSSVGTQTSLARIEAHVSNLIPRLDDLRDDLRTVREENKETLDRVETLSGSVSQIKVDMVTHNAIITDLKKEAEERKAEAKARRGRILKIVYGVITAVVSAGALLVLGLSK